jgi:hypothetical protein
LLDPAEKRFSDPFDGERKNSSSMSERAELPPFTAVKDFLVVVVEVMFGSWDFPKAPSSVDGEGVSVKLNSSGKQAYYRNSSGVCQ